MLTIRLRRVGRRNSPYYRVVLIEKQKGPRGKFIEILGDINPAKRERMVLKSDRITYWISKGASLSPVLHNILVDKKIISLPKVSATRTKKKAETQVTPALDKKTA